MTATTSTGNSSGGRRRSRTALIVVLVVVAALVVALVAGELFVRNRVKACLADQFESQLGSQVDIGLSPKPVLWQTIDKQIPYVTLESDDTDFGPAIGMNVHGRADDIDLEPGDGSAGTIGSSHADVEWSTDGILTTIQQESFGALVSEVRADQGAGTLTFSVGPAGLADLTVRPTVDGDRVKVETVGAAILGLGLPTDLVDGIVQTLTDSLQTYPLGMIPESLEVTDSAVHLTLQGGRYAIPADQSGSSPDGCSIV
ncbi:DUF2993 domain-containing protein [Rhodococcus sp. HNM0569]|uniref:LmeA family phospholipid-binding protein n=1 Tax=Rhodococcus sp. HNM0569 TaxID=2716340 RepID=UPI00146C63CE|nr:DUF2993 domain-containing protein [Rhodococcus sp. HNM0569]NLU85147.1 DUF2993 domain-containing protein [Rhodococcus sp. HNM0569]